VARYIDILKKIFLFSEPEKIEKFILNENFDENVVVEMSDKNTEDRQDKGKESSENGEKPTRRRVKNENLLLNKKAEKLKKPGEQKKAESEKYNDNNKENKAKDEGESEASEISKDLQINLEYIKKVYSIPINSDVKIREFNITVKDKVIPAFIVYIDGMVDSKLIDTNILQPLMLLSNLDIKSDNYDVEEFVKNRLIPHNQMDVVTEYEKLFDEVNFGGCGVFIDGIDKVYACDVKGFKSRSVDTPNTELVIRGPQEGFTEVLRVNTALVRKRVKNKDLIIESIELGLRSKTPCAILYIKNIANDKLVNEVRKRIESLKIDYITDTGELEQYIEDSTFFPAPQMLATERPDRVASGLMEGRVAVIMQGSPFALVMPITMHDLVSSPEDMYLRFPYANIIKIVRILGVICSLLLPGLYVAITNYHHEMIPTSLLFAIEASREMVPFPSIVEILIMEVAFELIREAGIRIPGPIGPTLGIIGALILGQAAVAANIVSPILIIVVAVTGIGSFAIPNFSFSFAFRLLRFAYIILGAMAGFLGITTGLYIQTLWFTAAKSFGVPYVSQLAQRTSGAYGEVVKRSPLWKYERRPDFLNPKDNYRQSFISRGWKYTQKKENDNGQQ